MAEEKFWNQPMKLWKSHKGLAKVKLPRKLSTSHTWDMMPTEKANMGLVV